MNGSLENGHAMSTLWAPAGTRDESLHLPSLRQAVHGKTIRYPKRSEFELMQTGLKRETVFAVGEVMRSTMEGKASTPLLRAPDLLHSCKFCHACGGDWNASGACDYFHDKLIVPPTKFTCKHWEIHPLRADEVPEDLWPQLLEILHIEKLTRSLQYDLEETYQEVRKLADILENLPKGITLPKEIIPRLEAIRKVIGDTTFLGELESYLNQQEGP